MLFYLYFFLFYLFNLKPLIPTEDIQLEAESRETFFFPSYMNIPHTVNQFIDRDSNKPLPDYAQYGRKLAGTVGGFVGGLGVPLVSKNINSMIDGYINEAVAQSIFETRDLNFEGSLGDIATRINEFSLNIEDEIGLELPEQLGEIAYNYAEKSFERQARSDFLEQNPKIRYASNFFGGLENINDVVSGFAGFGIGDIVGTAVYESLLKPSEESLFENQKQKKADTKIRQTKTETEIIDLDENKYMESPSAFETALIAGAGAVGVLGSGIVAVTTMTQSAYYPNSFNENLIFYNP